MSKRGLPEQNVQYREKTKWNTQNSNSSPCMMGAGGGGGGGRILETPFNIMQSNATQPTTTKWKIQLNQPLQSGSVVRLDCIRCREHRYKPVCYFNIWLENLNIRQRMSEALQRVSPSRAAPLSILTWLHTNSMSRLETWQKFPPRGPQLNWPTWLFISLLFG